MTLRVYFNRARYYSPTYQRFIAQDPIGFSGGDTNLYGYVGNDAVNLLDPEGLWTAGVGWTFGGGLGLDLNVDTFEGKAASNGAPIFGWGLTTGAGLGLGGSVGPSATAVVPRGRL
jgi:uncharacterized protein RhaS with RHS repeats